MEEEEAYQKGTGEGAFNSEGFHDSHCALKAAVGHEETSAFCMYIRNSTSLAQK